MLIYSDPAEDGFARGPVFPDGPWGPESHIQRGAITYDFIVPGDPLTPGWASLPGARTRETGGGALAAAHRGAAAVVEGRQAPAREHGRAGGAQGVAGGAADRVPARRRARARAPEGRDGQPRGPEPGRRGPHPRRRAAGRVDHPRQPPRRLGVRRRRPLERQRLADGADARARRAAARGRAAAAHARLLLVGRRGGRAHRLDRVGRELRGRAPEEGGRLPQRGLVRLGPRLQPGCGRLARPARPRPHAGLRGPRERTAALRGAARRAHARSAPRRASPRPRTTTSSTSASAAAPTTRCS